MPDSTEIHGDQKNITVFGFSAPWVVALTAVILAGVIGLAWVLIAQLSGDPDPVVVSLPPSSTPIVAPTDTPEPTPTTAPSVLIQPTALPTPTVAPTSTVAPEGLPPAPTEIPVPTATSIPVPDVAIIVPQALVNIQEGQQAYLNGVRVVTADNSRNYEVQIDWGDGKGAEPPKAIQADGTLLAVHDYSSSGCYAVQISASDSVLDPAENALLICVGAVSLPTPTPTPPPAATSTPVPPGVTVPPTTTPSPTPILSPTFTPKPVSLNAPTGISYQVSASGDVVLNWTPATSSGGPVVKTFIQIEGKPGLIELYGETTSLTVIPNGYFGFGSHRMRLASANDSGVGQWSDWTGYFTAKIEPTATPVPTPTPTPTPVPTPTPTPTPTATSADNDSSSWPLDGSKIAFSSNRDGNLEIYVMDADGSNQTRLTDNSADNYVPSWSPDGSKIVFNSIGSGSSGSRDIYVMDSDGSNQTRLTDNYAQE